MGKSFLKHKKKFIIDFTKENCRFNLKSIKGLTKNKHKITIIDFIYPLKRLNKGTYTISDHINLSGINPIKGPNFISLNNIYLKNANKKQSIVVAGLKDSVVPTKKEAEILLKAGANAYSYNLVPAVIYAASKGLKIKAIGIIKN